MRTISHQKLWKLAVKPGGTVLVEHLACLPDRQDEDQQIEKDSERPVQF